VNLILRSSLPLKQRQSYVGECSDLRSASREVFPIHKSVVRSRSAKCDSIAFIISANAREIGTPADSALEMIDVRWLQLRTSRLIMAAVLIQPRNRIRIGAAVVCAEF